MKKVVPMIYFWHMTQEDKLIEVSPRLATVEDVIELEVLRDLKFP
jgi:hypothetical protein